MSDPKQSNYPSDGNVSKTRNTPPFPARDCQNEVRQGNNGKMWISIPNKNNNYYWQIYNGTSHEKYIVKAVETGDVRSLKSSKVETGGPKSSKMSTSAKKPVVKKVDVVPNCDDDDDDDECEQAKVLKPPKKEKKAPPKKTTLKNNESDDVPKESASGPKYTQKQDKTGRIMYYNANGKRTAKKNVPEEYL